MSAGLRIARASVIPNPPYTKKTAHVVNKAASNRNCINRGEERFLLVGSVFWDEPAGSVVGVACPMSLLLTQAEAAEVFAGRIMNAIAVWRHRTLSLPAMSYGASVG
jgi:hypothetical protein